MSHTTILEKLNTCISQCKETDKIPNQVMNWKTSLENGNITIPKEDAHIISSFLCRASRIPKYSYTETIARLPENSEN